MLIVLRKLLELVLVVGEARVNAEIPAGRQTGDDADRQAEGRNTERTVGLTSRCLRPGTAAAAALLAGEHGGERSTRSLSGVCGGSGGFAPGFFWRLQ